MNKEETQEKRGKGNGNVGRHERFKRIGEKPPQQSYISLSTNEAQQSLHYKDALDSAKFRNEVNTHTQNGVWIAPSTASPSSSKDGPVSAAEDRWWDEATWPRTSLDAYKASNKPVGRSVPPGLGEAGPSRTDRGELYTNDKQEAAELQDEDKVREEDKLREQAKKYKVPLDVYKEFKRLQPAARPEPTTVASSEASLMWERKIPDQTDWRHERREEASRQTRPGVNRQGPQHIQITPPERKERSTEHYENMAELFPPDFPRFRVAENMNDIGAFLANASYFISLGGKPASEIKYGIIAVPLGSEQLLFRKTWEDAVMTPTFLQEVRDAQLVDYADGSLYGLDEESNQLQERRFMERSETDYSLKPFANPVIDPGIKEGIGKGKKRKHEDGMESASSLDSQAVAVVGGPARGHAMSGSAAASRDIQVSTLVDPEEAPRPKRARMKARATIPAEEKAKANQIKSTRATGSEQAKAGPATKKGKSTATQPAAAKQGKAATKKKSTPTKTTAKTKAKAPVTTPNHRTTRAAARKG